MRIKLLLTIPCILFSFLAARDETIITREFTIYEPTKTDSLSAMPTVISSQKLLDTAKLTHEQQSSIMTTLNQLIKNASLTPICNGNDYTLTPIYLTNEQGTKKQMGYDTQLRFQCIFKKEDKEKFDFFVQEIDKTVSQNPLLTFTPPSVYAYMNKQEISVLQNEGYNKLITLALSKVKNYSRLLNKKCYLRSIDLKPIPSYQEQLIEEEQPIHAIAAYHCN